MSAAQTGVGGLFDSVVQAVTGGNLDPANAARIMDVLATQARESGAALVLVTHSQAAAARADRVLHLRSDGIG